MNERCSEWDKGHVNRMSGTDLHDNWPPIRPWVTTEQRENTETGRNKRVFKQARLPSRVRNNINKKVVWHRVDVGTLIRMRTVLRPGGVSGNAVWSDTTSVIQRGKQRVIWRQSWHFVTYVDDASLFVEWFVRKRFLSFENFDEALREYMDGSHAYLIRALWE